MGTTRLLRGMIAVIAACLALSSVVLSSAAASASVKLPKSGVETPTGGTVSETGSTLLYPLFNLWASGYSEKYSSTTIQTAGTGSGTGISEATNGTIDIGASDAYLSPTEVSATPTLKNIPLAISAQIVAYNVPGVTGELKFTPDALAGIFLGKITTWNDPAIAKENPGVKLPSDPIIVLHRSDGSGTTYIFTDYLSKVSSDWASGVGKNTSVKWPVGLGGKGNEGVAGMIRQMKGGIGYIELIYAVQNSIPYGVVRNASGNYVKASLASVTAAAASVPKMPADFRVSITNAPGKDAYPISSFTWLLIPEKISDPTKNKAIKDFVKWMLADGQTMTSALAYAPLPKTVVAKETKAIAKIQ